MFAIVIFLDVLAVNSLCALTNSAGNLRFCFVQLFVALVDDLEALLPVLLLLCEVWVLALFCNLGGCPPNIGGQLLELRICWELMALSNQVVLVSGLGSLA